MSRRPRDYQWHAGQTETGTPTEARSIQSFAAMPLNLSANPGDRAYVRELAGRRFGEIAAGWKWYERLGTVRAAVERSAKIAGYTKFVAQKLAPDGTVSDEIDVGGVAEAAQAFFAMNGGTRGLVERFFVLMKIPAESWLIQEEEDDGFFFLSSNELDVKDLDYEGRDDGRSDVIKWVTAPSASGRTDAFHKLISPENFLGRVWAPGRQYFDLVNSAMPSLTTEFEILWWLTLNMRARLQNRYATAGMQYVPSEISEIAVTGVDGVVRQEGVLNYLSRAYNTNIAEASRGEAVSVSKILLRGEGKHAENFRNLMDDTGMPETDMKLRAEMRDTILGSLDVSKAGSTENEEANHFTAWHNADEERRIAVQPDIEMMCWALTRLAYRPMLAKRGVKDVEQYRLWFDLSDAQVKANLSEDARQARDRGLIGPKATRSMQGIKETEKMTPVETIQWAGILTKNPRLILHGVPGADDLPWDEIMPKAQPGPKPGSDADPQEAGPGAGQPGSPDDNDTDTPRTQRPA